MIVQEPPTQPDQLLTPEERRAFLRLPLDERRQLMAAQADRLIEYYETESETTERAEWQRGDIVEY